MSSQTKTSFDRPVGHRPPFTVLGVVLLASIALLVGIGYTLTDMQQQLGVAKNDELHLQELNAQIRYLDEVLHSSTHLAAATGDQLWEVRYRANSTLLDSALKELSLMSPAVYQEQGGKDVDDANGWLQSIQERSLAAAKRGDLTAARSELAEGAYTTQRKRYELGLAKINSALRTYIEESTEALSRGLWILVGLSVGSVFIAGAWCVWAASRTHKRALKLADAMVNAVRDSEREARKLAMVASRTDNAVLIADNHGRIEWVNEGFARMTGFRFEEVRGAETISLFQCPGATSDVVSKLATCIRDGQPFRDELVSFHKTGRRYWSTLDLEPIRDEKGVLQQFFAIQRDVTARKEAAERLEQSNRDVLEANGKLEEQATELRRNAIALERARAAAEAASRAKSEFLANMSHEIRTPLNGVIGALELMERTRLDQRQARFARMAVVSSESLLSLINDILDYSKLDAGAMELETIDISLASLCAEVGDMFAKRVEEKGITLSCEVSPLLPKTVRGDPTRLRQVMLNLTSNAIKFTERGGVVLRVTPDGERNGVLSVRFTVTDSGIGIPPERVDRLFKSFSQVDASTTRRYGGTGLGLAICRSIVNLMGGEIGVTSESGRGSTFWFVLPLKLAEDADGADGGGNWRLQDARVLALVANDDERIAIGEMLDGWKFAHVDGRPDSSALGTLKSAASARQPFDIVLISVPTLSDGLDLSFRITSDPHLWRSSVVLLVDSVEDSAIDARRLRAAGVSAWVRRPLTDSDLLDSLVGAMATCRKASSVASAEASRPVLRTSAPLFKVRILIAEDNEVNQTITTELLSDAGYLCFVAPNGKRAVEEALSGKYDLVLMDCQMPELDGYEASKRIRQAEAAAKATRRSGGRIPIIALTANALPADRERCLAAGMDDYLTKPLDAEALMAAVERFCPTSPASDAGSSGSSETNAPEQPTSTAPTSEGEALPPFTTFKDPLLLDLGELRNRCRGKTELMGTILRKFTSIADEGMSELDAAVAAGDLASTARLAHTLKGAAANLGAKRLSAAAFELENASKAEDLERTTLARSSVREHLAALLTAIPSAIEELSQPRAAQESAA